MSEQLAVTVGMSPGDFDCIFACRSDSHGNVMVGGPDGHLVRISTDPHMTLVDQEHAGGLYPDFDCFDAAAESALRDRGIQVQFRTLELLAGTSTEGTDVDAGARALRQFLPCTVVRHAALPAVPLHVVNSGNVTRSDQVAPYVEAGMGVYVLINAPLPHPQTGAQPLEVEDDADVGQIAQCSRPNGNVIVAQLGNNGDLWLKEIDFSVIVNGLGKVVSNLRVGQNGQINDGTTGWGTGLLPSEGIRCRMEGSRLVLSGMLAKTFQIWTVARPDGGFNFIPAIA